MCLPQCMLGSPQKADTPPPEADTPPPRGRHPSARGRHPSPKRQAPPKKQTTLQEAETPQEADTPPRSRHPPRKQTPLKKQTPPPPNTANTRAVRILLEFNLVLFLILPQLELAGLELQQQSSPSHHSLRPPAVHQPVAAKIQENNFNSYLLKGTFSIETILFKKPTKVRTCQY